MLLCICFSICLNVFFNVYLFILAALGLVVACRIFDLCCDTRDL